MNFCSLEEAFKDPLQQSSKSKKTKRPKEIRVPPQPPSQSQKQQEQEQEQKQQHESFEPEILSGPPISNINLIESSSVDELFPLPGDTGDSEEWKQAFTLGVQQPPLFPNGSIPVDGKSTQWRYISTPPLQQQQPQYLITQNPIPKSQNQHLNQEQSGFVSEISKRLDQLTAQLESLSVPTAMQGTAELFLFVAIGLLLLLAIDMILRFALSVISAQLEMGKGMKPFAKGKTNGYGRFRVGRTRNIW